MQLRLQAPPQPGGGEQPRQQHLPDKTVEENNRHRFVLTKRNCVIVLIATFSFALLSSSKHNKQHNTIFRVFVMVGTAESTAE